MMRHVSIKYGHARCKGFGPLLHIFKLVIRGYRRRLKVADVTEKRLWTAICKRYHKKSFSRNDVDLFVGSRL